MPDETESAPRPRGWLRVLVVFIIAFDAAAFFQWADGAFRSEFGGHADEATHYVSALRVREAARRVAHREDADGEHHPFAALRRTPPFDVAEGAWMLAFGTSRVAAMLFLAALAAATTTLIFCAARHEFGLWAATVAALLWLCAPAVRESYETISPPQLHALLVTAAAVLCAQLLHKAAQRPRPDHGWISVNAVFRGGFSLVIIIALGISLFGMPLVNMCARTIGLGAAVFALAGSVTRKRLESRPDTFRFAMTMVVAGVLVISWFSHVRPNEIDFVIAAPALAMLAVRGAVSLAAVVGSPVAVENPRRKSLWLFLLLLLALPADLLRPRQKEWSGFGSAAVALLEETPASARVLVVSDPRGESIFISELAMRDPGHRTSVERGSETIAQPAESSTSNRPREKFVEDEQLFAHLTSGKIGFIVLDAAVPNDQRASYHDQVIRVLEGNVRSFWPIFESPLIRDGEPQGHPLQIFRVAPSRETQLQLQ